MNIGPYPYPSAYQALQGQLLEADNSRLAQLQLLGQLHDAGTLTDQEFEREKQRLLHS